MAGKGVARVATKRTRHWQARIDRWFGDVAWGGRERALEAAQAWRGRAQLELGLPESPGQGITRHHKGKGWKARVTKAFGDSTFGGEQEAAAAATAWREDAEDVLLRILPIRPPGSCCPPSNTGEKHISRIRKDNGFALVVQVGGRKTSVSLQKWGAGAMDEALRRRDELLVADYERQLEEMRPSLERAKAQQDLRQAVETFSRTRAAEVAAGLR